MIKQYLEIIVNTIIDSLEEFFTALIIPTAKYIRDATIICFIFFVISLACKFLGLWCFINWKESLVAFLCLFIVSIVDNSTRSSIKKSVSKIKDIALSNNIESYDEEDEVEE